MKGRVQGVDISDGFISHDFKHLIFEFLISKARKDCKSFVQLVLVKIH